MYYLEEKNALRSSILFVKGPERLVPDRQLINVGTLSILRFESVRKGFLRLFHVWDKCFFLKNNTRNFAMLSLHACPQLPPEE